MSVHQMDYGVGYKTNHFRQARRLPLAVSQAAGALWEFRWGTALGHVCYINRLKLMGAQVANATAEELRFNLQVARAFTVVDSTNTTSILRSGDNQKLNGDSADSVLSAFVESNSATAAAGGTKTLDSDPICEGSYTTLATASTTFDGCQDVIFDYCPYLEGDQLLRLEQNEGWVINLEAAKGATAGFNLYLEVAWTEALKPQ